MSHVADQALTLYTTPQADMLKRAFLSVGIVLGVAATLVWLQHHQTMNYGFYYDDYHFVRPYRTAELRHVFHASWDRDSIETPYFRPLTIWFYAARFSAFGLNATAYHGLSLILFTVLAALFGTFVLLTSRRLSGALLASLVLIVHPALPYSLVAWVTNQMHLIDALTVLAALLWWFAIRRRNALWWFPLIALQVLALLIKEDGIMLLPVIVALHTARKYLVEPELSHVPMAFLASSAASVALLLAYRQWVLPRTTGLHIPPLAQAWANVSTSLIRTFRLIPAKRPYQPLASLFSTVMFLVTVVTWRWISQETRFLFVAGVVVAVLFDLPAIFIVKAEQLHFVGIGAALAMVAGVLGLLDLTVRSGPSRVVCLGIVSVGIAAMAAVTRNITTDFEPFSPNVLRTDRIVTGWAAVPSELRSYLTDKSRAASAQAMSSNPVEAVESVGFDLHGPEREADGTTVRWMSDNVSDLYVRPDARSISIPIKHEMGAFRETAVATISVDGQEMDSIKFTDDGWRQSSVALRRYQRVPLTRMHHVRIAIDHAWIPSEVIPGSTDSRRLGLKIGLISVR